MAHGNAMDYREHEKSYKLFTGMVKYGSIAVAVLMVAMYIFLV